ncbi:hypothetical protein GmRootA79_14430 [Acidovorax sp. A79]|uniref:hypothetical protein n=1 Tax=Acidovorax sp. A79 TaxID=3056107 RepID=UPI0034E8EBE7
MVTNASIQPVPVWILGGMFAGVCAGAWGASEWTKYLFGVIFGVSTFTLAGVVLLALLFFMGRIATGEWARYARNDFENVGPWALRQLQRGVSVLLGLALIALVSWVSTGSERGVALMLVCSWLAAPLLWCAYGLRQMLISQRSVA